RGHGHVDNVLRSAGRQILLGIEEEKPVLARDQFGYVNRTAKVGAPGVEPVPGNRRAGAIGEKVVGVEFFIALVVIAITVILIASGAGNCLHLYAGGPAILGLAVVHQHLDLADRIHVDGRWRGLGTAQIVVADAV